MDEPVTDEIVTTNTSKRSTETCIIRLTSISSRIDTGYWSDVQKFERTVWCLQKHTWAIPEQTL